MEIRGEEAIFFLHVHVFGIFDLHPYFFENNEKPHHTSTERSPIVFKLSQFPDNYSLISSAIFVFTKDKMSWDSEQMR